MSKNHFYSLVLVFVLMGVFTLAFNVQPAKVHASSRGETVQATDTDWWPMFRHDLNHTGTSTSIGPTTNYLLWKSPGNINWVLSSPAVVDGLVYVGSEDNNVHCLNAATGAFVWNYTTGWYTLSSPAVAGGLVYVGSLDKKVYCLNAATGAWVWSYTTGGWVSSSPAVVDGRVYVGSDDYTVYCLDASTGAHIWDYKTGNGMGYSCPAVVGGLVYVGSLDGKVYCLNAATGALVWSYTTGASVYSSPAVVSGLVYVGSLDGKVYCLNAATGAWVWSYTTGGEVWSSPAVAGGLVHVGSYDDNVYCLNAATGAFVWSYTTDGDVESSPAVAGGFVYVGSRDDFFYCLNSATGALVWSYETGGWVESSPAVVDGVVYVGSADGHVYAFGAPIAVSISPSSLIMDVGQSKQFNSSVTGGTSPYTYQWYLNDAPVSGATSSSWTFTPSSSGSYTVYVTATSQIEGTAKSNIATVTVNPAPSVTISPTSVTMDVGQVKLFSSSVSGGTSPCSYQWYLDDAPVLGATSALWTFTPSSSGFYSVYVIVTDYVGLSDTSPVSNVAVNPQLEVTINPSNATIYLGESQNLTSIVSGGTSPYAYQWYVNGAPVSNATSNKWTFTPFSSESYTLYLFVTDSAGEIALSPASNIIVNPIIPEFQPLVFPIVSKGTVNRVSLSSNSTISTFQFNQTQIQISFNVTGSSGTTGYCNITIPKQLMWAESSQWQVLVGGVAVTPTVAEDANNTYLYFTYSHSTKIVEIKGTSTGEAPQQSAPFPTAWIVATIAIIAIAGVTGYLFLKRKK